MKKRSGYSLIETLVVITMSAVVMATAVALLHSMFKADGATRDRAASQQSLRRLANDFRDDAHAAVRLSKVDAAGGAKQLPAWEFQMPEADRKVRYEARDGRLIREERLGGKTARRDGYRLPEGSAAALSLESDPPTLAVLRIAGGGPAEGRSGGLLLRVDAALASDHRFAKLGGK